MKSLIIAYCIARIANVKHIWYSSDTRVDLNAMNIKHNLEWVCSRYPIYISLKGQYISVHIKCLHCRMYIYIYICLYLNVLLSFYPLFAARSLFRSVSNEAETVAVKQYSNSRASRLFSFWIHHLKNRSINRQLVKKSFSEDVFME